MRPKTLFDKIWSDHLVDEQNDGTCLIYIDRHLVHEVTSPQAFEGLRNNNRKVRSPKSTFAVADHNVPTTNRRIGIKNPESRLQIKTLEKNCEDFGITIFPLLDKRQGIVHIVGPEQGITQPGMTIVCGDSHTATHGAFGALAFGIGTSEVEHVLATQTLIQKPAKNMLINVTGALASGVSSKDIILNIIGNIGTAGGTGFVIEYAGEIISNLSMESRMTICNMSIEAGARAGLISPDQTTYDYIKDRPYAPKGKDWKKALKYWSSLVSDPHSIYDKEVNIKGDKIYPQVTWGTSPQDVVEINGSVPDPSDVSDLDRRKSIQRSLDYMGLKPKQKIRDIEIDKVFIGSCTNGRIEDLREVAKVVNGKKIKVDAMVVPGSGLVKEQAEQEGIDKVLIDAGFDWREPGCSMCLAMNPDQLRPKERCVSTSNRNFEGRQGREGRTHLVSPAIAAASAVRGKISLVEDL